MVLYRRADIYRHTLIVIRSVVKRKQVRYQYILYPRGPASRFNAGLHRSNLFHSLTDCCWEAFEKCEQIHHEKTGDYSGVGGGS